MREALLEAESLVERVDLIDLNNLRCRFQNHVETGAPLFEVFDPVVDIAPVCARLSTDRRLLDPLESIYGEPAELFKDKLIFKPPGATGYALHQDRPDWAGFPESFITVLVAFEPSDETNGCTVVYRGAHRQGRLPPAPGQWQLAADAVSEADRVPLCLAAGDVAIFGCYTPHLAAPNRSRRPRRQLFLSYNARSDGGQQKQAHYAEFHARMRERYSAEGKSKLYFR
jgi:ectoine hydroxylase-related dioxygenase (phytanoyl-CoA dioxygenase family)